MLRRLAGSKVSWLGLGLIDKRSCQAIGMLRIGFSGVGM